MRERIHTWAREYIHERGNTYMGERILYITEQICTWDSEYMHRRENKNEYIHERGNTYMSERIYIWVRYYIHEPANIYIW